MTWFSFVKFLRPQEGAKNYNIMMMTFLSSFTFSLKLLLSNLYSSMAELCLVCKSVLSLLVIMYGTWRLHYRILMKIRAHWIRFFLVFVLMDLQ